jgi:hypothetical protein
MTSPRLCAAAVLSVLLLAAGCGGGDEDSGGDGDFGGDFAKQSGDEIAAAAKADMKSLDSVKYSGEIKSSGSSISLDIQASADGECRGTIGIGDGTAEVLATGGENWYRPDEAFWRQQAPDDADAIIAAVGDKWVIDSDASFSLFCDLEAFFDNIFKDEADGGAYKTTGTDEVDGQQVVKVEQSDEDGSSVGYVLVEGDHYLLKIERTEGDDPGKLEFSEFDEDVDVEAPGADEAVDPSTL